MKKDKKYDILPLIDKKEKIMSKNDFTFNPGDFVVYPMRGVGQIQAIQSENICGQQLDMISINFNKDKATVKIPLATITSPTQGVRSVSNAKTVNSAISILKSKTKAKAKKGQWVRRAQEYAEKIKSGNLISLAEILRELYKDPEVSEQTYSERQVFDQALNLFVPEFAISQQLNETQATEKLISLLQHSPKKA